MTVAKKIAFGVGCFHFAPTKITITKFDPERFTSDLKAALESVNNINNVSLIGYEWFVQNSYGSEQAYASGQFIDGPLDIQDGPGFIPHPANSKIEFDIFIPFRIQNDLVTIIEPHTEAEIFHITILYLDYFPVTIIEPIDGRPTESPSDSVVVVREFLKAEINKPKERSVEFQALGPSPFHANFFLNIEFIDKNQPNRLESSIISQYGYDDIQLKCYSSNRDITHIKRKAYLRLAKEIEFYYYLIQSRNLNSHTWVEIEKTIENMKNLSSEEFIFKRWLNSLKLQRALNDAFFLTTDIERHTLEVGQKLKKWKAEFELMEKESFIQSYLDKEFSELADYPTDQILRLINLFEDRRAANVQNVAILVAAVLGGLIGSAVTGFFRN